MASAGRRRRRPLRGHVVRSLPPSPASSRSPNLASTPAVWPQHSHHPQIERLETSDRDSVFLTNSPEPECFQWTQKLICGHAAAVSSIHIQIQFHFHHSRKNSEDNE
uniref:Uncharacterized protein n=1 Tax=Setaria viridis TaxID=4556 RepID=A0A4U6TIX4_SETVI|nr:hypothetical protein SEVIR_8G239700v2 [Setaria viridis]